MNTSAGTCGGYPRGRYIYSDATLADTEGGSSGSPVVNGSGQVVGQLFGACGASPATTCDTDDRTVDGAFAVTYSSISQWLDGSGGGGPGGGSCTGNNVWTGTATAGGADLGAGLGEALRRPAADRGPRHAHRDARPLREPARSGRRPHR